MITGDYRWLKVTGFTWLHVEFLPMYSVFFQESNKLFVEAFAHGTNSEAQTMISKDLLKIVLVNAHVEA